METAKRSRVDACQARLREGCVPCQKVGKHWRFHKEAIDERLKQHPENGDAEDFGHLDILVGDAAPAAVYARISDWLLSRAVTRPTSEGSAPASRASSSMASPPG